MEPTVIVVWMMLTANGQPFGTAREIEPRTPQACAETIANPDNRQGVADTIKRATGVDVIVRGVCHPVMP